MLTNEPCITISSVVKVQAHTAVQQNEHVIGPPGQKDTAFSRVTLAPWLNCMIIRKEVFLIEMKDCKDGVLMLMFIAPVMHCRAAITCKHLPYMHLCCAFVRDARWLWSSRMVRCLCLEGAEEKGSKLRKHTVWTCGERGQDLVVLLLSCGSRVLHKSINLALSHSAALYQSVNTIREHIARPWKTPSVPCRN